MRTVPQSMTDAWMSGDLYGQQRYMARATIQLPHLYVASVPNNWRYASWVMPQTSVPKELPNIKSITWDRDPTNGTGSCTIVLYNTKPLPLGAIPDTSGRLDRPGYYTYNRGHSSFSSRWQQQPNEWQGYLVYDRIIRTYEGYGCDPDVAPEHDPYLVQTGTWTIDDVDYDTDPGFIKVTCRDAAALLTEDVAFVPVVPLKHYPLYFDAKQTIPGPDEIVVSGWKRPRYRTDSGYDGGYVGRNASIYGHQPSDAFDTSENTFWLSIGNDRPSADYSFEYVEGTVSGTITGVRVHAWGGPYRMYVSVYANGAWQGRLKVPYNPNDPIARNNADIRYVKAATIEANQTLDIKLPAAIHNASRLRITVTHLTATGFPGYPYRGGLRDVLYTGQTFTVQHTTKTYGNYSDYTDIVKLFCALGGFWWPLDHSKDIVANSDGSTSHYPNPGTDPALVSGRVWGDFQQTGTTGVVVPGLPSAGRLTVDLFDKKALLDCVNYIRDIVAFIFMVDEGGGAIFRAPNIYKQGNWLGNLDRNAGRTTDYVTIDERNTLISLTAKVSGQNVRENIFVANINGRVGAAAKGINPYPTGRRRTAGWTDVHFRSNRDCQVMAELIALRQYMTMRADTITIPGYPGIQVDDQVRIVEQVTSEGYLHYVQAIHSAGDLETGKWAYTLTTNWLGEAPGGVWLWDMSKFSQPTADFLQAIINSTGGPP